MLKVTSLMLIITTRYHLYDHKMMIQGRSSGKAITIVSLIVTFQDKGCHNMCMTQPHPTDSL